MTSPIEGQLVTMRHTFSRADGLLSREIDGEFLVIDPASQHVVHLAGVTAAMWRGAGRPVELTDEQKSAVRELAAIGLLEVPRAVTRRDVLRRGGVVAAGVGVASMALPMASAAASVAASITLTPASGGSGFDVSVSGANFPANSIIQITFDGVSRTITSGPTSTNVSGSFTGTHFTVPDNQTLGAHTVSVVVGGKSASATYTVVAPTITLSQTTFPKNAGSGTFTVTSSSGFVPNSAFTDSAAGDFSGLTPASGTVSASGTIPSGQTYTVTYANGANKVGTITFTDLHGNTATVNVITPG